MSLPPPPSAEALAVVLSAQGNWCPLVGTERSLEKPALAPGNCDTRVVFAAFIWFPALFAYACNYQRHSPSLSAWAVLVWCLQIFEHHC